MNQKKTKFKGGDDKIYRGFSMKGVIGKGNSCVYEVVNVEDDAHRECVKEIKFEDRWSELIFRKEIELLTKLKANPHPNIVEYKGHYILEESRNGNTMKKGYIQMEKCKVNLKEYLFYKKEKVEYPSEDDILGFISSMIDAFVHLQKLDMAHRDAKPSNILIWSENPLIFKLCDVGAGTAVGMYDKTKQGTVIGTPYYLSPELYIAHQQHYQNANYNPFKSDVYSLGLVFLEFCSLSRLEHRLDDEQQQIYMKVGEIKKRYPNIVGIGKLFNCMLTKNDKDRMDFIELQKYIYDQDIIRKRNDSSLELDPELKVKLSQTKSILIQSFDDLCNISKIVSSGSPAESLKIELASGNGLLKNNQKELLEEIKNIKHINLEQFRLKMEFCELTEKEAEIIGKGITKSKNLKILSLNLWNNKIKNQGLATLLQAIQNILPHLEELQLIVPNNGIRLTTDFQKMFNLQDAEMLTKLDLNFNFNEISLQAIQPLFKQIAAAPFLEELNINLQSMKLSHIHFNKGMKELQRLTTLKRLRICASSNSIRDEGSFGLSDICLGCKEIEKLELILRHCDITDKGFIELLKSFPQQYLRKLKLNLIGNEITDKGLKNSPSFEKYIHLKDINVNLSHNKIEDVGVKQLTKLIGELKQLTNLRLIFDSCGVSEKGCLYIGRLLSQNQDIVELEISLKENLIELKGIQCLCSGLVYIKKLRRLMLDLEGTYIGDYAANYLASCLLKIRTLTSVDMNMENCNLKAETMENILRLVKEYSKKAEQITINMRKNESIRLELYEKIKKQLSNSRFAIKVDRPSQQDQP